MGSDPHVFKSQKETSGKARLRHVYLNTHMGVACACSYTYIHMHTYTHTITFLHVCTPPHTHIVEQWIQKMKNITILGCVI